MNEQNSRTRDFRPDYVLLELQDRADWNTARAHYRRLVHLWHPDKYAQRPRERSHAQQKFISLTKSYNNLRNFQRQHGRLPFEPLKARTSDEKMATRSRTRKTSARHAAASTSHGRTDTHEEIATGILGREPRQDVPVISNAGPSKRLLWLALGCTMLFATISVFVVLDRKASQKVIEQGREVIRQTPRSDFMPSAAEIRQSESKGAFVIQPAR